MNKKYQKLASPEEVSLLENGDLTPEEQFILGFLKGFNRANMEAWSNKGLGAFQNAYSF